MIAIINQGKKNGKGETLYNLQINNRLITTFHHMREDGLFACLRRASTAVLIHGFTKTFEKPSDKGACKFCATEDNKERFMCIVCGRKL